MERVLEVENLSVEFETLGGSVKAVRGVSFHVNQGETLAIVGESGSGKSVTAQSIMRILPQPQATIRTGTILFKGRDLLKASEEVMRSFRGADISMIFQDPMTALNPTLTIGEQLTEGVMTHKKISRAHAEKKAVDMLELVGISSAESRLRHYPHQFSGGMRQRIVIAMALICEPEILIADEPTTALDVTIQAQILELFKEIQTATNVSIILITHDLGVVAQVADRVAVMYAGKIIETGNRRDLFYETRHPYTKGLLCSVPRLDLDGGDLQSIAGTPPDLFSPPKGCPFTARCEYAMKVCNEIYPNQTTISRAHYVNCWLQDERGQRRSGTTG